MFVIGNKCWFSPLPTMRFAYLECKGWCKLLSCISTSLLVVGLRPVSYVEFVGICDVADFTCKFTVRGITCLRLLW